MNPTEIIRFGKLSIDHGLSQNVILCMVQDSLGFMWFGTQDGLNRYDGRKFSIYKYDRSDLFTISNNMILSLFEDNEGVLWAGTASGLNRYDREKDRFERYVTAELGENLPNDQIRSITQTSGGEIILATYGTGLALYNKQTGKFRIFNASETKGKGPSYAKLNSVYRDSKGRIIVGTWGGGTDIFDAESGTFQSVRLPENLSGNISYGRVNSISEDSEGIIRISTNGGLLEIAPGTNEVRKIPLPAQISEQKAELISCAFRDSFSNLWIGTREKGLWLLRQNSEHYISYTRNELIKDSISNNSVTSIMQDESGLLWAGTYGDGLNFFSSRPNSNLHFFHDPNDEFSINENKIFAFCETSRGDIWIGTRGKGASILNPETFEVRPFVHDSIEPLFTGQEIIFALCEDNEGWIWMGTSGGGLIEFDPDAGTLQYHRTSAGNKNTVSSDTIFDLSVQADGILWLGTSSGLNRYDKKKKEFRSFRSRPGDASSIASDRVRGVCVGSNNKLWISTEYGGPSVLDLDTFAIKRLITTGRTPIDTSTYGVVEHSNGNVWFGSASGVYIFDPLNRSVKNISEKEGLPNSLIASMAEDSHGDMWVSTNNGMARIDSDGNVLRVFDKDDGFQSNEFTQGSSVRLRDGRILAGGINGFNLFSPDGFAESSFRPRLTFTEFRLFNKPVTADTDGGRLSNAVWCTDEIDLSYRDSVISLEFAAMDFRNPNKISYKYMMDGFDKDWINSGNSNIATYTNLDHGKYKFMVKSTNSDGLWKGSNAEISLEISPPFWKRGWFKAAGAIGLISAGSILYQSKLNQIKKEKRAQEEFTRKLIEAQENDRKRIAAELHDSIGHGLLISKNRLQMSLNEGSLDEDSARKISDVADLLSGTLNEVREISYNLHPYQIERLGLTKAIRSIVDRVSGSDRIAFTCSVDEVDSLLKPDAEINLYRIIQECVNNVIRHSGATEAILNVSRNNNEISAMVFDNGKGINKEDLSRGLIKRGLGLEGMNERARIIGGELKIDSSTGEGTTVYLRIPLDSDIKSLPENSVQAL